MKTRKKLKAKSFRANEEIIQNTGDEKELLFFFFLREHGNESCNLIGSQPGQYIESTSWKMRAYDFYSRVV